MLLIDPALLDDLLQRSQATRWDVHTERFSTSLVRSANKAFEGRTPTTGELRTYLRGLHLEDLALACACEDGHEAAWEHFVLEFRPRLYRAAAVMDATGGAREVADAIYAELFGLTETAGVRASLFRYFHGRSSLATWLRSVLAQRWVDRVRLARRYEPLEDEDLAGHPAFDPAPAPDRPNQTALVQSELTRAIHALAPRDRLRLACYYAQSLTLAQIGRLTGEHEATVSRHLARTRKALRVAVEDGLRRRGVGEQELAESIDTAVNDVGAFDLEAIVSASASSKESTGARSKV